MVKNPISVNSLFDTKKKGLLMKKSNIIILLIFVIGVCAAGLYCFSWSASTIRTNSAKVDADVCQLTANANGKLIKMSAYQNQSKYMLS
jgi:Multidrug resistance efflux pump